MGFRAVLQSALRLTLAAGLVVVAAQSARAQVLVDFDGFVAGTSPGATVIGAPVDAYLGGYGITFSSSSGASPAIQYAPGDFSAGIRAPSSPNHFFGSLPTGGAFFYSLTFETPLTSFSFDTPALGPSSTMAAWSATAYSSSNATLSSVSNPSISFPGTAVATYTLTGGLIDHVTFMSNVHGFAGHQLAVDNFVLTPVPEPETYAMLIAGLGLLAFEARRRRRQARI